jgi:acetyltransferase-like isoleucine patch superfamily enzyme
VKQRVQLLRERAFRLQANRRSGAHRLSALGRESVVVPPATILSPHRIQIGDRVLVFGNATFSVVEEYRGRRYAPRLRIGDETIIGHGMWFSCVGEIDVGSQVLIGHGVLVADSFHEYADRGVPIIHQPMAEPRPVRIGGGAILGPGVAILSGATIGEGSYVAANSVVASEVPPHAVAAGNPAEIIRRWDTERAEWIDSPDERWRALLGALTS